MTDVPNYIQGPLAFIGAWTIWRFLRWIWRQGFPKKIQ